MNTNIQPLILVVDDDPLVCRLSSTLLEQEGYAVVVTHTDGEGYAEALRRPPDLAILGVVPNKTDGLTLCRRLRENPSTRATRIILVTSQNDKASEIKGLEAGADVYMTKPFTAKEFRLRVRGLMAHVQMSAPIVGPTIRGQAIAVFGTKGGIGKTTIAVNLAIALQQRSSKAVALFDADFYFGDAGDRLNLPPVHGIEELIGLTDELEWDLVKQVMLRHASGIQVLLSPAHSEQSELITPLLVKHLLDILTQQHAFVVVDCLPSYDERMLTILDHADEIVLVMTPEIGPLKTTIKFLDVSEKLGLVPEDIHVVLNRADSNLGIGSAEVEKALRHKIAFRVNDGGHLVAQSANRGVPLIMEHPTHPVSQQIVQIADSLIAHVSTK